jgi:hypothetical protein
MRGKPRQNLVRRPSEVKVDLPACLILENQDWAILSIVKALFRPKDHGPQISRNDETIAGESGVRVFCFHANNITRVKLICQ